MKFIALNGPSCAGKSTIVQHILEHKERYYQLSYDSLKWSFSQYAHDTQYNNVRTIMRAIAKSVCEMQYHIVCDSLLSKDGRDALLAIPKEFGYEIIEINLEADYEVLRKRFDARVADRIANPSRKVSNTSTIRFREIYDRYQTDKNPHAITFRTDTETIDDLTKKILEIV